MHGDTGHGTRGQAAWQSYIKRLYTTNIIYILLIDQMRESSSRSKWLHNTGAMQPGGVAGGVVGGRVTAATAGQHAGVQRRSTPQHPSPRPPPPPLPGRPSASKDAGGGGGGEREGQCKSARAASAMMPPPPPHARTHTHARRRMPKAPAAAHLGQLFVHICIQSGNGLGAGDCGCVAVFRHGGR